MRYLLSSSLVVLALGSPALAVPEGATDTPAAKSTSTTSAHLGLSVVPEGTEVKIVADSKGQKVISPTALCFDESGAMLIAETHRFRFGVEDDRDRLYWYLDDLAAQTTEDRRAMHEKWKSKVSIESLTKKSEIVRRLVDTDGDGVFETSNVFADGFNDVLDGTAAGIFSMDGTAYFACIPKIWMLRDADKDGKAEKKEVLQDGFGVRVSFSGHDMNGFALGPDGRIYGTIGDRGFNITTKEGRKYVYPGKGATFRFDPDGSNFEVVHTGLRNPKEIAFDDFGNAFTVDNNSDQGDKARVVYLVEGGESGWEMEHQTMHSFHRQIGLTVHPPNRWMAERMWEPKNDAQPAYIIPPLMNLTSGPSGLTYHPGAGFVKSEAGRFLICDYKASAAASGIWSFKVEPDGAGMKVADSRKFAWGIPATDVEYSWDGKIYIADFMGGWSSHDDGRVISLDAGKNAWRAAESAEAAKLIREGFDQRSSSELASLLKHADQRVRLRAEIALTRKNDALQQFTKATTSDNQLERLHGVWGLGILTRRGALPMPDQSCAVASDSARTEAAKVLGNLLTHKDAETRAQAVKALEESPVDGNAMPLAHLLADESPRVRAFAAITAGKRNARNAVPAILAMLKENADRDPYLRLAGAGALQQLVSSDDLAKLASDSSKSVRLAAVVALRRQHAPQLAAFLNDTDTKVAEEAIRSIHDESIEAARPAVAALLDKLDVRAWKPFMQRRLLHSAYRLGGIENAKRLLAVSSNTKLPDETRLEALRLISVWTTPPPADQSTGHIVKLDKRNADEIKPLLAETIPTLLKEGGPVVTDAFALVSIYNLSISSLDDSTLRSMVTKGAMPGKARAQALGLYAARKTKDLAALLTTLSADKDDDLALSALKLLVERFPKESFSALSQTVDSNNASRAQAAWKDMATLEDTGIGPLFVRHLKELQEKKGVSPSALELLATARVRKEPEVKQALDAYEASVKASSDPLAAYMTALEGGNAKAGAALFESQPVAQCLRCHRAEVGGDNGGEAGPNLAGVAKRGDRKFLLESLVNPNAKVASGFGVVSIALKNGASVGGILLGESPEFVDVDVASKRWRVKRSDITSLTPPASAMPPMGMIIKQEELRDLVAWLSTLEKSNPAQKAAPAPPILDPATLK